MEDYGNSDWVALDPPSGSTMLLSPSDGDVEELGTGNTGILVYNISLFLQIPSLVLN